MKKTVSIILALVLMLSSVSVFADTDIALTVNGKVLETDVPPVIKNDRTMVPFRAIFEALDIEVNWSSALRKAYATSNGVTVILTVDSDKMVVNDTFVTLEVAPFIMNDRVLVPARAVCEALECTVTWDPNKRVAAVKTKDYIEPEPQPEPSYSETIGGDPEYIIKDQDFIKDVFELINAERASLGLSSLTYDEALENVAYYHSLDMAEKGYLDHVSPEGLGLQDRLDNAGIVYTAAGENLASGFTSAQSVVTAWKNSPSHYQNITNSLFTRVGLGYYAGGENGTYWTLVLAGE